MVAFTNGQENLVPNGDFEDYNWCPKRGFPAGLVEDSFYIHQGICNYWSSPTQGGTPDYFHACSDDYNESMQEYEFSVPENYAGFQYAHSGDAYAGIWFAQTGESINGTYAEYIQVVLKQRLEKDVFYRLAFYMNPSGEKAKLSEYPCTNSIGALFTEEMLNLDTGHMITIPADVQNPVNVFYCDTSRWYKIAFTYKASGNEKYLTIGVFRDAPFNITKDLSGNISQSNDMFYFIDDVSLVKVDNIVDIIKSDIPNVFTPNQDGVNDIFHLKNVKMRPLSITILNRWGNVVYFSETEFSWDGMHKGKHCTQGIYFYKIAFKDDIMVDGFVRLVR